MMPGKEVAANCLSHDIVGVLLDYEMSDARLFQVSDHSWLVAEARSSPALPPSHSCRDGLLVSLSPIICKYEGEQLYHTCAFMLLQRKSKAVVLVKKSVCLLYLSVAFRTRLFSEITSVARSIYPVFRLLRERTHGSISKPKGLDYLCRNQ